MEVAPPAPVEIAPPIPVPVATPVPTPPTLDPSAALVAVRLAITDLQGNPVQTIRVGESFRLAAYVQDLREGEDADGVFAAFLDVDYDASLARPSEELEYRPDLMCKLGKHPFATAGKLDDVGGILSLELTDGGERELFNTTFTATSVGELNFASGAANRLGLTMLLHMVGYEIPASQVTWGSASVTVVE